MNGRIYERVRRVVGKAIMNVIVLTIFIGLVLVFVFIFLFMINQSDAPGDRDALLPLTEEKPSVPRVHSTPPKQT